MPFLLETYHLLEYDFGYYIDAWLGVENFTLIIYAIYKLIKKMMCVVLFSAENPKLVSRSLTFYTLSKLWHYWHIDIHCIMFYFNNISTFQQLFLNYDCRCDVDMLLGLRKFTLNPIVKREQKSRNLLLVGYCDIINSSIFLHFY